METRLLSSRGTPAARLVGLVVIMLVLMQTPLLVTPVAPLLARLLIGIPGYALFLWGGFRYLTLKNVLASDEGLEVSGPFVQPFKVPYTRILKVKRVWFLGSNFARGVAIHYTEEDGQKGKFRFMARSAWTLLDWGWHPDFAWLRERVAEAREDAAP